MTNRRSALVSIASVATTFAVPGVLRSAAAQADFPSKPLKIIVAFPPGGTSDVIARLISEPLGRALGQPVVVENIGGGGGTIGMDRALKLPADGYTLIQTGVGQNAVAHGLDATLKYNSLTDFTHLTQVNHGPNVLVVNASQPYKSVKDLVEFAKANPGKLDYGFTHAASGHMAMELFKQRAGIFLTGIPYRGGGPLMNAILANEIPMMFINQDVALPHVKAGKLRPLAVSSLQRNPLYADVPTVAESGYPGFQALSWSGLSVAKGTPQAVVDKLDAALKTAIQSAAVKGRLESQGFVIPTLGQKAYGEFVAQEIAQWAKVIKTAGIKPQ